MIDQLNDYERQQIKANFTNPTRSLGDAWFYAGMMPVGNEVWLALEMAMNDLFHLAEDMLKSGLVILEEISRGGASGVEMQAMAERRKDEDPRFARLLEITKARFLVAGTDYQTNLALVDALIAGVHPGEAFQEVNSALPLAKGSLN